MFITETIIQCSSLPGEYLIPSHSLSLSGPMNLDICGGQQYSFAEIVAPLESVSGQLIPALYVSISFLQVGLQCVRVAFPLWDNNLPVNRESSVSL